MPYLRRLILALCVFPVAAAAGLFLFVVGDELWGYVTRTHDKAEAAAWRAFVRTCLNDGLDPAGFYGPEQSAGQGATFNFAWAMHEDRNSQISVSITYLPYAVTTWKSERLSDAVNAAIRSRHFFNQMGLDATALQ